MTQRLVINSPKSSLIIVSDDIDKMNALSDFCKKELGAVHDSENIDEYKIPSLSEEMSNKLYSLLFKLELL